MKSTSRDIRIRNCFSVLRHLIADYPTSRQYLARETDLSVATVSNLVSDLIELGVVVEVGLERSGGGRPRALLAPNAGSGALIGIDVASTYVKFEAYDLTLTVLCRIEEHVDLSEDMPEQLLDHIATGMAAVREHLGGRPILGIGVSLPGQVDVAGGISVFAPNWNWHDVAFKRLLTERLELDVPVYLDNSLKTVTAGELWFGDGRGVDRLAVVLLGTGVGVGLAFGGDLYRGASNSAGEWGHATVDPDGPRCRCGRNGCIEAYVGAPAILRRWGELAGRPVEEQAQEKAMETLAQAWKAGEDSAVRTVEAIARDLAVGVANLVNIVNPELVVLTGWVTGVLGEALLPELERHLPERVLNAALKALRVKLDEQSRNMVILGAAALALEGHLNLINTVGSRSRP
ncbi:ROK family transcriptional regulator [Glycomyces xiaoerkulensis]|uniref:ROK family transcriptional regulator n=1 Tax=Glycomyces xiaoerkulensis TaxID=2038139 RepID=UPI000C266D77|nr:ROK family transcriptional regulator [Glycomyces xiaoerkulensis]